MQTIKDLIEATKTCPEHPIYHPEGTTYNHILLVMVKSLLATGNMDIVLAALFHDIMKPNKITGQWKDTSKGKYWSNEEHDKQAADLVKDNDDVRYFIKQTGGHVDLISDLCRYHMGCKETISKKGRLVKFMDTFVIMDDMAHRKEFPVSYTSFPITGDKIYRKQIYFVGQNIAQQRFKSENFTITINNCPEYFKIKDIPDMFFKKDKWALLNL